MLFSLPGMHFSLHLVQLTQTYLLFLTQVFIFIYSTFDSVFSHPFINSLGLKLHTNFCDCLTRFCLYLQTLKFMRVIRVDFCLLLSGTYQMVSKCFLSEQMNELYTCKEFSVKALTFYNFVYPLRYGNYSKAKKNW